MKGSITNETKFIFVFQFSGGWNKKCFIRESTVFHSVLWKQAVGLEGFPGILVSESIQKKDLPMVHKLPFGCLYIIHIECNSQMELIR